MALGFFKSMFDFSFSHFITLSFAKVIFVIAIVFACLEYLALLFLGFGMGGRGILGGLVARLSRAPARERADRGHGWQARQVTSEPSLRQWLRELPSFDRDRLPEFNPALAPETPAELYLDWLRAALGAGVPVPHAMVLATAGADGEVSARTLILKDINADTWCVATSANSLKAAQLRENPHAALTVFWGALGRQVRVTGQMSDLGDEVGAADFDARPAPSRAAALVGRQGEVLADRQQYWDAFSAQLARLEQGGVALPSWRVLGLRAATVEFWQATADAGQVRLHYRRTGEDWEKELLWP